MTSEEREQERRQSLNAARGACEWLKYHIVHTSLEPLEGPILLLIKGFEILDEKEREQAPPPNHPPLNAGGRGGRGENEVSEIADIEKLANDKAFRDAFLEKTVRESIARQIKELRAWKGWTQEDLAGKLNTKANAIARLENPNSKSLPRISTLCAIAAVFDVALMIRFAPWDKFLIVMGEQVLWGDGEDWLKLQEWAAEQG